MYFRHVSPLTGTFHCKRIQIVEIKLVSLILNIWLLNIPKMCDFGKNDMIFIENIFLL